MAKMTGYIIRRSGALAVQKVAIDAFGSEREVDWAEGLTHDDAVDRVRDCQVVHDKTIS